MSDGSSPGDEFAAGYRVRFDEAAPDGRIRTSGLLRYSQDLAAQHSESLGYDRAWYAARGLTWLVRAAEVAIVAAMPYGSLLQGATRVLGFRRVWSRRESVFTLPDGSTAASVRIDWVLLDERGRPARIPAEFERVFPAPADTLQLGRVTLGDPAPDAARRAFRVRPQELDPMDHVNNAAYADWVDEAILAGRTDGAPDPTRSIPRRLWLEYALAAEPDSMLKTVSWFAGGGWSVRISGEDGGVEVARARLEGGDSIAPDGR